MPGFLTLLGFMLCVCVCVYVCACVCTLTLLIASGMHDWHNLGSV